MRMAVVLLASCAHRTHWAEATEVREPIGRRIEIVAGRRGFAPTQLHARAGETITLVFIRTDAIGCVERVHVYLDDRRRLERTLPLGQSVSVTLRLPHAGEVGISCAMRMFGATIVVDP